MILVFLLFVAASLLIIAEVLFPSFGVLSLLALSAYVTAVVRAFEFGQTEGYLAVALCVIIIPGSIALGFQILKHTSFGNRLVLKGPDAKDVTGRGSAQLADLVGLIGRSASPLRPSGVVEIGDEIVSAQSDGGWIPTDVAVKVVFVEGNRVVVEQVETPKVTGKAPNE